MNTKTDTKSIIWINNYSQEVSFTGAISFAAVDKMSIERADHMPPDCIGMWDGHYICRAPMSVIEWYVNEMEYLKQRVSELEEEQSIFENTESFDIEKGELF